MLNASQIFTLLFQVGLHLVGKLVNGFQSLADLPDAERHRTYDRRVALRAGNPDHPGRTLFEEFFLIRFRISGGAQSKSGRTAL